MAKKAKNKIKLMLWLMVANFTLVLLLFFATPYLRVLFLVVAVLALIFTILGIVLVIMTLKKEITGKLKFFLILTGSSAAGLLLASVLHNLFYALAIVAEHITWLNYTLETLHVIFFLISIPICPAGFVVGIIGGIILSYKKAKT